MAEEGPEPILESLPPVDFNRLMLTPIPKGVPAKIPEKKDTTSAPDHAPAREKGNAWERHENLITHVASTTGGEYYLPHPQVDIDDHEEGPEIFPEDLLFFYENGDKGAHGNKNYYIPFNVSPGDLIPETQAAPSRATYRRQP